MNCVNEVVGHIHVSSVQFQEFYSGSYPVLFERGSV